MVEVLKDAVSSLFYRFLPAAVLAWGIAAAGNSVGDQAVRSINRQYEIFKIQSGQARLESGDTWSAGQEKFVARN